MNETAVEAIIVVINALGTGILLFVSGVAQRMMNELEPLEFKNFLNRLDNAAMSDPVSVAISTIPTIVVIFYLVRYGFHHWWFVIGLVLWMVGASITKVINTPIYNWAADPKNTDPEELKKQRRKLQLGNYGRAWVTLVSIAVMLCQFSVEWTLIAVAALALIMYPSLWLSNKFKPHAPNRQ